MNAVVPFSVRLEALKLNERSRQMACFSSFLLLLGAALKSLPNSEGRRKVCKSQSQIYLAV